MKWFTVWILFENIRHPNGIMNLIKKNSFFSSTLLCVGCVDVNVRFSIFCFNRLVIRKKKKENSGGNILLFFLECAIKQKIIIFGMRSKVLWLVVEILLFDWFNWKLLTLIYFMNTSNGLITVSEQQDLAHVWLIDIDSVTSFLFNLTNLVLHSVQHKFVFYKRLTFTL